MLHEEYHRHLTIGKVGQDGEGVVVIQEPAVGALEGGEDGGDVVQILNGDELDLVLGVAQKKLEIENADRVCIHGGEKRGPGGVVVGGKGESEDFERAEVILGPRFGSVHTTTVRRACGGRVLSERVIVLRFVRECAGKR